jgi:hypothetical protein
MAASHNPANGKKKKKTPPRIIADAILSDCSDRGAVCELMKASKYEPAAAWGQAVKKRGVGASWDDPIYRPVENFLYALAYPGWKESIGTVGHHFIKVSCDLLDAAGASKHRTVAICKTSKSSLCAFKASVFGIALSDLSEPDWRHVCGDCK